MHSQTIKQGIMTQVELINQVKAIKGCVFAHIEYYSEEKLPKKLGLGNVTKYVATNVQLNYGYENAVNNRIERAGGDGNFVAGSLPFGKWETPNKIIEYKGNYYLRFYLYDGSKPNVSYIVDGRPATKNEVDIISEYKKGLKKNSDTQSAAGLTQNQVKPRMVKFESITNLKCGGVEYTQTRIAV